MIIMYLGVKILLISILIQFISPIEGQTTDQDNNNNNNNNNCECPKVTSPIRSGVINVHPWLVRIWLTAFDKKIRTCVAAVVSRNQIVAPYWCANYGRLRVYDYHGPELDEDELPIPTNFSQFRARYFSRLIVIDDVRDISRPVGQYGVLMTLGKELPSDLQRLCLNVTTDMGTALGRGVIINWIDSSDKYEPFLTQIFPDNEIIRRRNRNGQTSHAVPPLNERIQKSGILVYPDGEGSWFLGGVARYSPEELANPMKIQEYYPVEPNGFLTRDACVKQ
ncbi:uncharacterized protein LOC141856320 [Brevipalpus obovatus]|uniref:uncharacterized protein LOC141856320 n=1 Tax=Brevipalpus obovatus TaxID=246614 RepID=UPI003D9F71EB